MRTSLAVLCAGGVLLGALSACVDRGEQSAPPDVTPGITGIRYLATGADSGFARADSPRAFEFPVDHGPHPEFRTEWWYFTGNVLTETNRHFGFELTFFRLATDASVQVRDSAWQASDIWMANFAVTNTTTGEFFSDERIARSQRQLAYSSAAPFAVRVEDWSVLEEDDASMRLRANSGDYAIDLKLENLDRIVLQGDRGYDRKGPESGNASYYYSAPRLVVSGTITAGESVLVSGTGWLDREWSTSALSPGIDGWDWFALQLSDGRDLMYYRLRSDDGGTSPFSSGTLTDAAGIETQLLGADSVELTVSRTWRSPVTGVVYPVAWRLSVPSARLEVDVAPRLENQEINLSVRYWEGAVDLTGTADGKPITGVGYLELAGYQ